MNMKSEAGDGSIVAVLVFADLAALLETEGINLLEHEYSLQRTNDKIRQERKNR